VLSESSIKDAGIFDPDSVVAMLKKMKASERTTEVENMSITSIISAQLLYRQFIKGEKEELTELLDSRIINDK
jgi:asparagine synthase (glutamine-hydrolysing)